MATLDSAEARRQFVGKLGAEEDSHSADHNLYFFKLGTTYVASTKISKGPRHTIDDDLTSRMARQLGVASTALAQAVQCTLDRDSFYQLLALGTPYHRSFQNNRKRNPPRGKKRTQ